jgi:hypothetical protein
MNEGRAQGAILSQKRCFVKKCTKILKTVIDKIYYKSA